MAKDTPKNLTKETKQKKSTSGGLIAAAAAGIAALVAIGAYVITKTKNIFNEKDKPGK